MRKTFGALSDKLLSGFVAKVDVAAACLPDPWYRPCYCRDGQAYRKRCALTGPCKETCGPCVAYKVC